MSHNNNEPGDLPGAMSKEQQMTIDFRRLAHQKQNLDGLLDREDPESISNRKFLASAVSFACLSLPFFSCICLSMSGCGEILTALNEEQSSFGNISFYWTFFFLPVIIIKMMSS